MVVRNLDANGYLKKAEFKDINLLYQWRNDETVRLNSFSNEVISYEDHLEWLQSKLSSDNTDIYIYYYNEIPVGQIRLDFCENYAIISYSIDKEYRGMGHGSRILQLIEKESRNRKNIEYYIGRVKYTNITSQKRFKEMGYSEHLKTDYIEYIKSLPFSE